MRFRGKIEYGDKLFAWIREADVMVIANLTPEISRNILLSMALGGAIGDPLNGRVFDIYNSYRPLFLLMAVYTALAFVTVLFIPRRAGEAETGPDSIDLPVQAAPTQAS